MQPVIRPVRGKRLPETETCTVHEEVKHTSATFTHEPKRKIQAQKASEAELQLEEVNKSAQSAWYKSRAVSRNTTALLSNKNN